jgi:glucose-6-phosphate isomerase
VTNKPFKHVINIGIGGSHFGPKLCIEALKKFNTSSLSFQFISAVSEADYHEFIANIDIETTLFIISSKSFTTIETITLAKRLIEHVDTHLGNKAIQSHFVAITACPAKALRLGISQNKIFRLWDWVGGRYSIWSAIGLPLMLMIGYENFRHFLQGAYEMDQHFQTSPLLENMPVILALLDVWYCNFFEVPARIITPYTKSLKTIIPYLQQTTMESLGKRVDLEDNEIDYNIGIMIFGETGPDSQHSYHQHLHQSTSWIPIDFILQAYSDHSPENFDAILFASCLSQAQALMQGKSQQEIYKKLISQHIPDEEAQHLACHQTTPGNRPSNIIVLQELSPYCLGSLLALYEHKIFVLSVIWNINAFDQWGVELGKQLLSPILNYLNHADSSDTIEQEVQDLVSAVQALSTGNYSK